MSTFEENKERILSQYVVGSTEWFSRFRYYYDEYHCESKEEYIDLLRKFLSAIRNTAAEYLVGNTQIKFNDEEVEDFYTLFDKLKDDIFSDGFNDRYVQICLIQKELCWLFEFDIWGNEEEIIIHYAVNMVGEDKERVVYYDGRYHRHFQSYYYEIAKPFSFIRPKSAVEYFDYIRKEFPDIEYYFITTVQEVYFNNYIELLEKFNIFTLFNFDTQSVDVISFMTKEEWKELSTQIGDRLYDMRWFEFHYDHKTAREYCEYLDKECKNTPYVSSEKRIEIK